MEDCVTVFTSVESGDEEDLEGVVENALEELRDVAGQLNTNDVVLYPYAHLSEDLATPEADCGGVRPADSGEYDRPTDPLADSDVNALESELEDPRFQTEFWTEQIELQLDIGKKAEQQALASRGLDFVTDEYLPARLDEMGVL